MKSITLLLFAAAALGAATPDWARLEPEALDLLQRYIRIPSVNPPADTRDAANFVKGILEKEGIAVTLYTAGPAGQVNLLARLPGRDRAKKPLLLLNHLDVVPVDKAAWRVDPFAAVVENGMIWGRGSMDMKSIGMQHILSLVLLKRMGIVPARDIVMLSTCDEETGGVLGISWMIEKHFAEFAPEYVLDEGGFVTREILSPGKLVAGIAVGEKQMAWIRLRAKGTAAHGSQPIPDNANLTLLQALPKALALGPAKPHPVVAEMRANIAAPLGTNKYTAAIQANTASLTTLTAGVGNPPKINVIPSNSEATLDCRLLPGVNVPEFVSEMKARVNDPRVSIDLVSTPDDPGVSNYRTPLFEVIRKAISKEHPAAVITPMLVPHGTDSNKLRKLGIPAYGLTPMLLDLTTGGSMHSDAEHVPVSEYFKGLRIFHEILTSEF